MDTSMLVLMIVGIGMSIFVAYKVLTGMIYKIKSGRVSVKVPKLRGRSRFYDEKDGICEVVGFDRIGAGMEECVLHLWTQSGHLLKKRFHRDEIEPINSIEAIASPKPAVWRAKGSRTPKMQVLQDIEKYDMEQDLMDRNEKLKVAMAEKEIAVNQAARFPDTFDEIIKEALNMSKKGATVEQVRIK